MKMDPYTVNREMDPYTVNRERYTERLHEKGKNEKQLYITGKIYS
jgi:hypothetical protein